MRPPRLPRLRLILAAAASLALFAACDGGPEPVPTDPTARWLASVDGLCEALDHAGDAEAAERAFVDRSHDALHEIAAAATEADREAAAALLTAKNRVEADFEDPPGRAELEGHLQTLIAATVDALTTLGIDAPGCA
ncbi:MAG: hypothetical protein WD770_11350 [Actinomycetota bacterium]